MKHLALFLSLVLCLALAACGQSKDALYEKGVKQFEEGNYNGAIVHFKNVLEKDPNAIQARLKLGAAYLETGKFEQAEKEFQKVLLQNPYDPEVSLLLGKLYNFQRKPDQALEALTAYLKDHPGQAAAEEQLGYTYTLKGEYPTARSHFLKAVDREPERISAKLGVVESYINEGDRDGARKYLTGVLAASPNNRQALHLLASLEEGSGDGPLATYQKIASLYPSDVFARYKEARLLLDKDGGEAAARKLIQDFPDRAEGYKMQGILQYRSKSYAEAVLSFQRALKIHPDLEAYYFLGLSYYGKGDLETAVSQMQTVVDYSPSFVRARQVLGQIFLQQRRLDEAMTQVDKILEVAPKDVEAFSLMGDIQLAKGDTEAALGAYGKALEIAPQMAVLRAKRGSLLVARGRDAEAQQEMLKAVEAAPRAVPPRLLLSAVYLRANQPENAVAVLEQGLNGSKADSLLYNALAKVRFFQGKNDDAFMLLGKAKESDPDNLRTYHNLAFYYILTSQSDKAVQEYVSAIEKDPRDLRSLFSAAAILDLQGKQDEALKYLLKAKATGSQDAYVVLSRFHLKNKNPEAALQTLDELLAAKPDSTAGWQMKAGIFLSRKENDKAMTAFDQIERINPRQGLMDKVEALTRLGQFDKARESADKLIQMNPRAAMSYVPLAWTFEAQKDLDGAIAALGKGLAAERDNPQALMLMGQLCARKGDQTQAMSWYDKALAADAEFAPAYAAKGVLQQVRGDLKEAARNYNTALDYDEHNAVALNNLAMIYADQDGRQAECLKLAMTAFENASTDPGVIDTLGYALLRNGRAGEALRTLQKADALRPKNPIINYHMAMAYKQLGQKNEALSRIQVAMDDRDLAQDHSAKTLLKEINGM